MHTFLQVVRDQPILPWLPLIIMVTGLSTTLVVAFARCPNPVKIGPFTI